MIRNFILLIALFTITISYSNAQIGDLFSPMQGVPACQTAEPDRDFIAIMTASGSDGQINFNFDEFKSSMWIYIMRSKTEPYTIASYGVLSMMGQYTTIPAGIEEDSTMQALKVLNIDGIVYKDKNVTEKLKSNPDFIAYMAANPTVTSMVTILVKSEDIDMGIALPASFKNTEMWAFNINEQMVCLVNAMTGETYCTDVMTAVEDISSDSPLAVYPNPSTDVINVTLGDIGATDANVIIFDIYGRELLSSKLPSLNNIITLPVSNLSGGIYIIEVNANGKVFRNKFNKL